MAKAPFHVLYNQDCTDLFAITHEPLTQGHVERMVDEVADGGADVLLINPNAQRVNYPSHVWQTFWDGYAPDQREFFGPVPEQEVAGREGWVRQMQRLAAQGCDYLACALARCRARGIHPGVSLRMNDMHDVPWPGSHLFSRFYLEHPELRLHNPPASGWSAEGLNYVCPEVRAHYLALVREIVAGYDFDVLELDFLRFTSYFPRTDFARHCAIMTDFLREVRALLQTAPRPITLIPRVATHPAAAYELGFDVAAWAREGLVDAITTGAFLNTAWQMPVDAFRALVGDAVAIYACADASADRREGLPIRHLPLDARLLRGFAAGYLAAGADGVCFFNFFTPREETPPHEPLFNTLGELHTLDALCGKAKTYLLTAGVSLVETDEPLQVPVPVADGQARTFTLWLAAEPADTPVEIDIIVVAETLQAPALWLSLNATPLGCAQRVTPGPAGDTPAQTLSFTAPAAALHDGRNTLCVRNEGGGLTVLGVDVRVGA